MRILERTYDVKDLVYICCKAAIKGVCKKLGPIWKGPGVVAKKLSAYLSRVKIRNTLMVLNHENIDNPYFEGMVNQIYPPELQLNKANTLYTKGSFLDLHLFILTALFHPKCMINVMTLILIYLSAPF